MNPLAAPINITKPIPTSARESPINATAPLSPPEPEDPEDPEPEPDPEPDPDPLPDEEEPLLERSAGAEGVKVAEGLGIADEAMALADAVEAALFTVPLPPKLQACSSLFCSW